jgi:hypothetical protein
VRKFRVHDQGITRLEPDRFLVTVEWPDYEPSVPRMGSAQGNTDDASVTAVTCPFGLRIHVRDEWLIGAIVWRLQDDLRVAQFARTQLLR